MNSINVQDLPEPVARAIQAVVEALRQQLHARPEKQKRAVQLPTWPGSVRGPLTRQEIYGDAD